VDLKNLTVSALQDYKFYKAVSQDYRIILNANEHYENFLNKKLHKEFIDKISKVNINRYPHPDSVEIREKYARFLGVKMENVLATVGSDQGIRILTDTFVDTGDYVISFEPTFSMYKEQAILSKGKYIGLESDREDLAVDIDYLIQTANDKKAKIVYICTPNNPTGYLYSKEEIKKVIDNTEGIVAIDEAYIDFAEEDNLDLIYYSNRVVILRTLSKAYSAAGLRVGFMIGQEEIINYCALAKPPYNLSLTSEVAAEVLIENSDLIKEEIKVIKSERERVVQVLKGYKHVFIFPLNANFITIRTKKADEFYHACENRGISIRAYKDAIKDTVRITVGSKAENDEIIEVIKEVF